MINTDFKSILELVQAFPDEQTCINHLEELRWNGNVVSPFDPSSIVYKCKGNKYKCKNTGKYFNVRTSTLFDNTKIELRKWFMAIYIVTAHKKGISSLQLSRDLHITQKSSWFMLQRIRNCFGIDNDAQLDNEVEVDETFIGGKNKNKHAKKKNPNSQGGGGKAPVIGLMERGGKVIARKIENRDTETLTKQVVKNVKQSAILYTDEHKGYGFVGTLYKHHTVNHSIKQYVDGSAHTNTLEGFWSLLKRGIIGIYHFTSPKHLQKYVDEFTFRYNTRKLTERNRFNLLLSNSENRLTYKVLTNGRGV